MSVQNTPTASLRDNLRQMVAMLQEERQALAGLDLDAIMGAAVGKQALCDSLGAADPAQVDDECRGLLDAARRLNEVNRQVRNLVAANVEARLEVLTGSARLYRANGYRYAGQAAR